MTSTLKGVRGRGEGEEGEMSGGGVIGLWGGWGVRECSGLPIFIFLLKKIGFYP